MDVFKIDQSLNNSIGGGVPGVKSTTEVTFDTNADFNLSFFESSTPPPSVSKKESDFLNDRDAEGLFESMTSESLFSPVSIKKEDLFEPMSTDYPSPFTSEDSKFTSFSDSAAPSTIIQTPPSPAPTLSPHCDSQSTRVSTHSKVPIIIKSGEKF